MDILYQNRNPQWWNGGDMIKMRRFQDALRSLGHNVEFAHSSEMRLNNFKVVHGHNLNFPWTWEQCWNAYKQRKPFVCSTIFFPGVGDTSDIRRTIDYTAAFIVFSEKERDAIMQAYDLPQSMASKFHVVTNGVSEDFYSENLERDIDVLVAGSIHPRKNQEFALDICNKLGIVPTFVGAMSDERYYHRLMQSPMDFDYVQFATPCELAKLYARAKVVIQPSLFDPFPNTVLEAGMAGCQVVVTDKTFIPDSLPNIHTLHINNGEQWMKTIEKLLKEWTLNTELQKHLKENYNWKQQAKKLSNIYHSVL